MYHKALRGCPRFGMGDDGLDEDQRERIITAVVDEATWDAAFLHELARHWLKGQDTALVVSEWDS